MVVPEPETSDETLAARAVAGDDSAFETLVTRYQARVFRLAARLTGNEADAFDALQDAFLQVYRHLTSFRGDSRFGTWLYRIATNAALATRRTRARQPTISLDDFLPRFDSAGGHDATPNELQIACRADELLDRELLAERAREAVAQLPALYRAPFVLRDLEEMPTADVARVLDIEPAAVRQRVHRARLMLRGYLTELVGVKP